jgi:hypothetical protein
LVSTIAVWSRIVERINARSNAIDHIAPALNFRVRCADAYHASRGENPYASPDVERVFASHFVTFGDEEATMRRSPDAPTRLGPPVLKRPSNLTDRRLHSASGDLLPTRGELWSLKGDCGTAPVAAPKQSQQSIGDHKY